LQAYKSHGTIRQQESGWRIKQGIGIGKILKDNQEEKELKNKRTSMLIIHSAELAP
jgi:hypothetical protein